MVDIVCIDGLIGPAPRSVTSEEEESSSGYPLGAGEAWLWLELAIVISRLAFFGRIIW